jgi:hypothetical protein
VISILIKETQREESEHSRLQKLNIFLTLHRTEIKHQVCGWRERHEVWKSTNSAIGAADRDQVKSEILDFRVVKDTTPKTGCLATW